MRRRGPGKTATLLIVAILGVAIELAWAAPALAQRGVITLRSEPVEPAPLRSLVGVGRAEALVISRDADERLRGIDRLAAIGSDEAVKALASAMAPGTLVRTDPRTRLAGVRALAPHVAKQADARRVMVSVLNSVAAGAPETPLEELSRATAALALARVGSSTTLTPLLAAVIGGGRTGELAREAILAFPPTELGPLGRSHKELSVAVISLLGELGDPRVLGILRRQLKRTERPVRHAAAIALAKLGDGTPLAVAGAWGNKGDESNKGGESPRRAPGGKAAEKAAGGKATDEEEGGADDPAQRIAGAEVLMWLDAPRAATAIAHLLGEAATRSSGLRLAERSLSPALVPTLQAVVAAKVTPAERARAAAILAKIGGDAAAPALAQLLAKPELATTAAFGLAASRGGVAADSLEKALEVAPVGAPRRLVMRAAVVRFLKLRERVPGLTVALEQALASADAADRAVGAFGLVVLGERGVGALVGAKEPEVAIAAAQAALALGSSALTAAAAGLRKAPLEPDAPAVAAAVGLLVGGHGVSTQRLLEWAEGGSSLAPLAALQLARRDSAPFRERLVALLDGTDPLVRLHVALGLADSPEADAVALLVDALRFETDVRVRRGIVRALSRRSEKRREPALAAAAALDPDAEVRAIAASAKRGRTLPLVEAPKGREVAWVSLRANDPEEQASIGSRPAMLVRDDGLALPVVSAPDGVILVPGVGDRHQVSIEVAPIE